MQSQSQSLSEAQGKGEAGKIFQQGEQVQERYVMTHVYVVMFRTVPPSERRRWPSQLPPLPLSHAPL